MFGPYCHYLLTQPSIEQSQALFLGDHFTQINEIIQDPQLQRRLIEACRPIWAEKTKKLEKHLKLDNSNARSGFFVTPTMPFITACFSGRHTQPESLHTTWAELGNGSYNAVYRSADGGSVFKYMYALEPDPESQELDNYDRSVRLWNEINPTLSPPASVQQQCIDGGLVWGWVCPYVEGRQSTDREMKQALIDLFNQTGRIVLDATSYKNFKTTPAGKVVCVDVGWALRLDKENKTNKPVSLPSFSGWGRFDAGLFSDHYHAYPKTIDTINALLFIKLKYPELTDAAFLKSLDVNQMIGLTHAYDEMIRHNDASPIINAALELLNFYHTKNQCVTALKKLVNSNYQASNTNTFGLFRNTLLISPQAHTVCIELLRKIRAAKSIAEIHLHVMGAGHITEFNKTIERSELIKNGILGKCMLFIAKQKPEIVNFRSDIYRSITPTL